MNIGENKIQKKEMKKLHAGSKKNKSCQCGCTPAPQPKPAKCEPATSCGCPLKGNG